MSLLRQRSACSADELAQKRWLAKQPAADPMMSSLIELAREPSAEVATRRLDAVLKAHARPAAAAAVEASMLHQHGYATASSAPSTSSAQYPWSAKAPSLSGALAPTTAQLSQSSHAPGQLPAILLAAGSRGR